MSSCSRRLGASAASGRSHTSQLRMRLPACRHLQSPRQQQQQQSLLPRLQGLQARGHKPHVLRCHRCPCGLLARLPAGLKQRPASPASGRNLLPSPELRARKRQVGIVLRASLAFAAKSLSLSHASAADAPRRGASAAAEASSPVRKASRGAKPDAEPPSAAGEPGCMHAQSRAASSVGVSADLLLLRRVVLPADAGCAQVESLRQRRHQQAPAGRRELQQPSSVSSLARLVVTRRRQQSSRVGLRARVPWRLGISSNESKRISLFICPQLYQ